MRSSRGRRFTSILLITMITFSGMTGFMIFFPDDGMTVSATTLHVPGSYSTIQAAIDNASGGDTILVANGTYWGSILLNKNDITLKSNSTTDCTLKHHFMGTHRTSGFAAVINITADGCSVTGFNISTTGNFTHGIMAWSGSERANIDNNVITTADKGARGVYIYLSSPKANITNNVINAHAYQGKGIEVYINCPDVKITNNDINTTNTTAVGIDVAATSPRAVIKNNTIVTHKNFARGIAISVGSTEDSVIHNNTITTFGNYAQGIWSDSPRTSITWNIINTSGESSYGILTGSRDNSTIENNTINTTGLGGIGININNNQKYTNITNNEIQTNGPNAEGINIDEGENCLIFSNNITTIDDDSHGIQLRDWAYHNMVINNTIHTSGSSLAYGIYLLNYPSWNDIYKNTIVTTGGWGRGIWLQDSAENNFIVNNQVNTSGNYGFGIGIKDAQNNTFTNNRIKTSGNSAYGLRLYDISQGNYFTHCNFTTLKAGSDGLLIEGNNATFDNCTIYTNSDDVAAELGSVITFINTTFSGPVELTVNGGGTLKVKNYLHAQMYYEDMSPMQDGELMVEDNGQPIYSTPGYGGSNARTDAKGQINYILVDDRWYVNSNTATENVTKSYAKKTDVLSWSQNYNENMSTTRTRVWISSDIRQPSIPANLTISRVTGTNDLNISWDLNADTVNYTLWQLKNSEWVILDNITHPKNWTIDTGLLDEAGYSYKIEAWDSVNLSSGLSEIAYYYLTDITPPATPTGLNGTPVQGGDALNISWNLNLDDTLNYSLMWRDSPTGEWLFLANISSTESWYIWSNENLVNGTFHYFKLRAWDKVELPSNYSEEINITHIDYEKPSAPTNLMASSFSVTKINLSWIASISTDVEIYRIYISLTPGGGQYTLLNEVPGSTNKYQAFGLLENVSYYFVVTALDEANNPSVYSNEAMNTTLAVLPISPILNELPAYTNQKVLNVTGNAEANVKIIIFSNGNEVGNGSSNETGEFGIEISLIEGDNEITARALDSANLMSGPSNSRKVNYDKTSPIANAGPDVYIKAGETATFNGTGSSDNNEIVNYTWTFEYDGQSITLYSATPKFVFEEMGIFIVTLQVIDIATNIATDTIEVNVTKAEEVDVEPPIADAGPDKELKTGQNATLDGSGSTDNVGISNYTWTFTYADSEVTLYGKKSSFKFTTEGNYKITLTVMDFSVPPNIGTDTVWINVTQIIEDKDTDDDGMKDSWEDDHGFNKNDPNDATGDADSDELTNLMEHDQGTDPRNSDSDTDGLPDGWELNNGLDPLDNGSVDINNGPTGDLDKDGYTNMEEFKAETDPQDSKDKPADKKDDDDNNEADNLLMYLILILIIVVIVLIIGLAMRKKTSDEEEYEDTDEEDEYVDENEMECPECGAVVDAGALECPECGAEFEEEDIDDIEE